MLKLITCCVKTIHAVNACMQRCSIQVSRLTNYKHTNKPNDYYNLAAARPRVNNNGFQVPCLQSVQYKKLSKEQIPPTFTWQIKSEFEIAIPR